MMRSLVFGLLAVGCGEEVRDPCIELVSIAETDEVTEYRYDPTQLTWWGEWQTIGHHTEEGGENRGGMWWGYNDEGDIAHSRQVNRWNAEPFEIVFDFEHEYGPSGEVLRRWSDFEGDGTWSEMYTYTYDALLRRTGGVMTWLPSGEVYETWSTTYTEDERGTQAHSESDYDADGVVDSAFEWTENADGEPLYQAWDSGADGVPEVTRTYGYRSDGKAEWGVEARDGEPYEAWAYTYTDEDRIERVVAVSLDTLAAARTFEYAYDDDGLLTRKERDWDGDGAIDESERHTYQGSCWAGAERNPGPPVYR